METATFGGGCFWCVEAVYDRLHGVTTVTPGYAGGEEENPTYEQVSMGNTGHAEVIQINFDPNIITYDNLLHVFWKVHDPTTVNRQGNDVGEQYRSIILYHNDQQRKAAEQSKRSLEDSGEYSAPIVTEIVPLVHFYPAEDYHNDYYENNRNQPYCRLIIDPKIKKLEKEFSSKLK